MVSPCFYLSAVILLSFIGINRLCHNGANKMPQKEANKIPINVLEIKRFIKAVLDFELFIFFCKIPVKKILLGWTILVLITALIPVYLVWVTPDNIPLSFLYFILAFSHLSLILPVSVFGIINSLIKGFRHHPLWLLQIPIWVLVMALSLPAGIIFIGSYYDSLKTIHFNLYYPTYEKSVSEARKLAMENEDGYAEKEKGILFPSSRISAHIDPYTKDLTVYFYKQGSIPTLPGGIMYFDSEDTTARNWHKETSSQSSQRYVSNYSDHMVYRKLRPHWYLYTNFF